ncbi:hypothetical protein AX14_009237, partial [Amanita brunnescens Koide BX004]
MFFLLIVLTTALLASRFSPIPPGSIEFWACSTACPQSVSEHSDECFRLFSGHFKKKLLAQSHQTAGMRPGLSYESRLSVAALTSGLRSSCGRRGWAERLVRMGADGLGGAGVAVVVPIWVPPEREISACHPRDGKEQSARKWALTACAARALRVQ